MLKRVLSLLLIFFISFAGILSAQTTYDFLRVDMSPRAAALGGSFVSNNDDPEVIFYNPAGMYSLENSPASVSFVKHLLDINLASVVYSTEFEGIGRRLNLHLGIASGQVPLEHEHIAVRGERWKMLGEVDGREMAFAKFDQVIGDSFPEQGPFVEGFGAVVPNVLFAERRPIDLPFAR